MACDIPHNRLSTILYNRWDDIDFIRTLSAAALEGLARDAKMQPGHAAKFVALIGEQQAATHNSSVRSCLLQRRSELRERETLRNADDQGIRASVV